jgi:hypothetical protein
MHVASTILLAMALNCITDLLSLGIPYMMLDLMLGAYLFHVGISFLGQSVICFGCTSTVACSGKGTYIIHEE